LVSLRTNFRPDQVSSIAATLTSTRPAARPIRRTSFSSIRVGRPELFFGQQIQTMPSWAVRATSSGSRRVRGAASVWKVSVTSIRLGSRRTVGASSVKPPGARSRNTTNPGLRPSLRSSAVPE
jgi:hypothetical protein